MSSEAVVQQQVRLALARMGALVYRNNSGAYMDDNGRMVRYGLGNDSAQLNAVMKSPDLICVIPVVVQPHHVGRTFGLLGAVECKPTGWHMTPGDKRALAQQKFIDIVKSAGGVGGIVSDPAQIYGIVSV